MVSVYSTDDFVKSTVKWQVGDILMSDSHVAVVVSGACDRGYLQGGMRVAEPREFDGWNTAADGTGHYYRNGEQIYSTAADTIEADGYV